MCSYLKILDWEESYFKYRKILCCFNTSDLRALLEGYLLADSGFDLQIQAIRDELEFRNSPLGKELW